MSLYPTNVADIPDHRQHYLLLKYRLHWYLIQHLQNFKSEAIPITLAGKVVRHKKLLCFFFNAVMFCRWSELLLFSYSSSSSFVVFFFNWRYNPWWVLACFTIWFHNLYTSLSNFSLLSSLNLLLSVRAISVLVFLLTLMNMAPIQFVF